MWSLIPAPWVVAPLWPAQAFPVEPWACVCCIHATYMLHAGFELNLRPLLLPVQCFPLTGRLAGCRSVTAWETSRGSGTFWNISRQAPPGQAPSPWRSSTASRSSPGSTPGVAALFSHWHKDPLRLTAVTQLKSWSRASPGHAILSRYNKPESACEHTGYAASVICPVAYSCDPCISPPCTEAL